MMHKPEGEDNVEDTELLNRMMAYAFTDKLATITVTLPCGGNVGGVGIDTEILARGKEWQHIAGPAADIQNVIVRLRPNVLVYEHAAAIIGADQRVIELVKEGTIEDRSNVFDHIGHRWELCLVPKIAYCPPKGTLRNRRSNRWPALQ